MTVPIDAGDQSETTIYAMPGWRMALSAAYVYSLLGDVARCEAELALMRPPAAVKRWEPQRDLELAVAYARAGDTATASEMAWMTLRDLVGDERGIVVDEMYREIQLCATDRLAS